MGENNQGFVYYPNPVTSVLCFDIVDSKSKNNFVVTISNQAGKIIKQVQNKFHTKIAIKVNDLPKGNYVLLAENGSGLKRQFVVR